VSAAPPAAVLAVDGGNSKTEVALVGRDGTVLSLVHGAGTPMEAEHYAASTVLLRDLVREAAAGAGIDPGGVLAEQVAAFHAGLDVAPDEERLRADLTASGWGRSVRVGNDTFAVLRAGTARPWGVAVACGAGLNCVGVAPDGSTTRFLALGRCTGDWGSGRDLAEEVLWSAARAEDGRGDRTALAKATAAQFGVATMHEVCVRIHLGQIGATDLHQLVPLLFRVATAGDAVAAGLVARLADEISRMVLIAMRRLALSTSDTEVVLGGSVLTAGHTRLLDRLGELIRAGAPAARIRVIQARPVIGAALLGLDRIGADPAAHRRLLGSAAAG
jgi:N-acetylglucosamine kinase-like BadF-type ATPase